MRAGVVGGPTGAVPRTVRESVEVAQTNSRSAPEPGGGWCRPDAEHRRECDWRMRSEAGA